jgi:general secretion pathway protein L
MLRDLGSWWMRQMLDLLPARLADMRRGDALIVTDERADDPPGLGFAQYRRRTETRLGRFGMDAGGLDEAASALREVSNGRGLGRSRERPREIVLRLAPGALLERTVRLPLAAERDPASVLRYEMDRLTPVAADDVVWSFALDRRDRARSQLLVRLSLVPLPALRPLLDALGRVGVAPTALEAETPTGDPRRLALTGGAPSGPGAGSGGRLVAIAAAFCAVCAVAALVTPFIMQAVARGEVERRIAGLAPRVSEVETLRRRVAAGVPGADVIATERARIGDALQVLATVTDILADDTVLSELSLRQGKLGISGQALAAAKLIPTLAADPLLRNPAFVAPVTRATDEHGEQGPDQFVIRADLAQ